MGHRLSVVLIVLNTMGFFACLTSRAQFSQSFECL